MKVSQLMSKSIVKVRSTSLIPEVAKMMKKENVGALPVEDEGRLVGIVTDRDITINAVANGGINTPIREVMSSKPITIQETASAEEAIEMMIKHQVRRLMVMRAASVIGMVTLDDLADAGQDQAVLKALRSFHKHANAKH